MRVAVSSLIILMFLLNLSCTAVNVQVKSARGGKGLPTDLTDLPPIDIPPTDQASLPHQHPCQVDKAALCPPGMLTELTGDPCNAPAPEKTLAQAQQTTTWCWAASAAVVMVAHDKELTQCQGVEKVLNRGDCCSFGEDGQPPLDCQENGWPYEIFNKNDFDWDYVDGPLDENTIGGQLCRNGPFIFVLELQGGGYHTLVVKSVEWTNGETYLYVDDHSWLGDHPFGGGPPTGFQRWSYEEFKAGLWLNVQHKNIRSFVAIRPL